MVDWWRRCSGLCDGYDVQMVQQTRITIIDDLDEESEAAETVRFGLDAASYEIDLSDEHADELRTVLRHYANAGRRTGGARRPASARPKAQPRPRPVSTPDEIRAWAPDHGLEISSRGRISTKVREAYDAAHQPQ